jgi:predicted nuclease with TOPRIM domain
MTDKNEELIREIAINKTIELVERLESSLRDANDIIAKTDKENASLKKEMARQYDKFQKENADLRSQIDQLLKDDTAASNKIAELEESYSECDEDRRNIIDEVEAWRLRWEKLKDRIERLLKEHCPEDDISGISCSTCDYLNKVKKKMQERSNSVATEPSGTAVPLSPSADGNGGLSLEETPQERARASIAEKAGLAEREPKPEKKVKL